MTLSIVHRIAIPAPQTHLVEVETTLAGDLPAELVLFMPVWTPGSYLVREYARHVEGLAAAAARARRRRSARTRGASSPAARARRRALPRVRQRAHRPHEPRRRHARVPGRRGACSSASRGGSTRRRARRARAPRGLARRHVAAARRTAGYEAPDFDTLVDSPIEIGHRTARSASRSSACRTATPSGRADARPRAPTSPRSSTDTRAILEKEATLFGGALPYDAYELLLHLSPRARGGLEHARERRAHRHARRASPRATATSTCSRSSRTRSSTRGT